MWCLSAPSIGAGEGKEVGRRELEPKLGAEDETEAADRRSFIGRGCEVVVAEAKVVWGGEICPVGVRSVGEEITPRPVGRGSCL